MDAAPTQRVRSLLVHQPSVTRLNNHQERWTDVQNLLSLGSLDDPIDPHR